MEWSEVQAALNGVKYKEGSFAFLLVPCLLALEVRSSKKGNTPKHLVTWLTERFSFRPAWSKKRVSQRSLRELPKRVAWTFGMD